MKDESTFTVVPLLLGSSNAYLLITKNATLIIDTGSKNRLNRLQSALKRNNLRLSDIKLIILTHTHHDHAGNAAELKDKSGAKLLVHTNEAQYIKNGFSPIPRGTDWFSKLISSIVKRLFHSRCSYAPCEPDIVISGDYDLSPCGLDAKVVHTPGHTSGSLSVILEKRIALVGDTMFNLSRKTVYPLFADDEPSLLNSWRKLIDLGCKEFYPGHGIHFPREKVIKTYNRLKVSSYSNFS